MITENNLNTFNSEIPTLPLKMSLSLSNSLSFYPCLGEAEMEAYEN